MLRVPLALWLASCTGGGDTTAPAPQAPTPPAPAGGTRDTLFVGVLSDVGSLVSVVAESDFDLTILDQLTFGLVDEEFDCSLKWRPGMATSWDWNADGTVLSMTLRDDLKWEDGQPVTAEDIAYTYELISDPTVQSPRVSNVERLTADGRPKIVDPTHIEWHFTKAYDRDTQMGHVAFPPLPKHVFANTDRATLRASEQAHHPVSNGPWRIAQWLPQQQLVLEPNATFAGPEEFRPKLSRVIFKVLPEYSTRLIELEAGSIDLMAGLLVADADRLRETHPELRLVRRGWRSEDHIVWNLSNPLFQDPQVRKALAMATNVDRMIGDVLTGKTGEAYARRSIGTVTPALCGVHNDDVVPLPFEVEKAKQMLAEAGWKDTDKDGVLDKDGKKFAFELVTNDGNKRRADTALLFQSMMNDIGVQVSIRKVESNQMFDNIRQKKYEAALMGWAAGLSVDPSTLWHCDTPDKKYEFNYAGYCNPDVDKLIDQGLSTPDPRESAPIWKEVQAKIYADQPYLFLWWMDEIVAVNSRFENTHVNVLSYFDQLHEWEVPADKVKYPN